MRTGSLGSWRLQESKQSIVRLEAAKSRADPCGFRERFLFHGQIRVYVS
jgi:hypothetical protein